MAPNTLRKLVSQQRVRAATISRTIEKVRDQNQLPFSVSSIKNRLFEIRQYWDEFRLSHAEIAGRDDSADDEYVTNRVFETTMDEYQQSVDHLEEMLADQAPQASAPAAHSTLHPSSFLAPSSHLLAAPLPRISLPTFSGKVEDWPSFCDLFTALVHDDKRYNRVTKLKYLKDCLTGEAAEFIRDVAITDASYDSTWMRLNKRYAVVRLHVYAQFSAIDKLPSAKSGTVKELRALADKVQQIVRALQNLRQVVPEDYIVYSAAARLDSRTADLWANHLSLEDSSTSCDSLDDSIAQASTGLHSVADFVEVVERRIRAIGVTNAHIDRSSSLPVAARNPRRAVSSTSRALHAKPASSGPRSTGKCPHCSGPHFMSRCERFKQLLPEKRREAVIKLSLCFNCLGFHKARFCQSKARCSTCNSAHHSLLHASTSTPAANTSTSS